MRIERDAHLRFDRSFNVWAYGVSGRQLLIRSPRERSHAEGDARTRIDLYFSGVEWMSLEPRVESMTVRPATAEEAELVTATRGVTLGRNSCLWMVGDPVRPGFVVAVAGDCTEDFGEHYDPSAHFQVYGTLAGLGGAYIESV